MMVAWTRVVEMEVGVKDDLRVLGLTTGRAELSFTVY